MDIDKAFIKKDIYVAVISGGSMQQKASWLATCKEVEKWVFEEDTQPKVAPRKRQRKADTAKAPAAVTDNSTL